MEVDAKVIQSRPQAEFESSSPWAKILQELVGFEKIIGYDASNDQPTLKQFAFAFQFLLRHYQRHIAPWHLHVPDEHFTDENNGLQQRLESIAIYVNYLLHNEGATVLADVAQGNEDEITKLINGDGVNFDQFDFAQAGISPARIIPTLVALQNNIRQLNAATEDSWDEVMENSASHLSEATLKINYLLKMLDTFLEYGLINGNILRDERSRFIIDVVLSPQLKQVQERITWCTVAMMNQIEQERKTTVTLGLLEIEAHYKQLFPVCYQQFSPLIIQDATLLAHVTDQAKHYGHAVPLLWPKQTGSELSYSDFVQKRGAVKPPSFAEKCKQVLIEVRNTLQITPKKKSTQPDIAISSPTLVATHTGTGNAYNQVTLEFERIKSEFVESQNIVFYLQKLKQDRVIPDTILAQLANDQTLFDQHFSAQWQVTVDLFAACLLEMNPAKNVDDQYITDTLFKLQSNGLMAHMFALQTHFERLKPSFTLGLHRAYSRLISNAILGYQQIMANLSDQTNPALQALLIRDQGTPEFPLTPGSADGHTTPPSTDRPPSPISGTLKADGKSVKSEDTINTDKPGKTKGKKKTKWKTLRRKDTKNSPIEPLQAIVETAPSAVSTKAVRFKTPHRFNPLTLRTRTATAPSLLAQVIAGITPTPAKEVTLRQIKNPQGEKRDLIYYPDDKNKDKKKIFTTPGIQLFQPIPHERFVVRYVSPLDKKARDSFISSIDPSFQESLRELLVKHEYFDDAQWDESNHKAADLSLRESYFRCLLAAEIHEHCNAAGIEIDAVIVGAKGASVSFQMTEEQEAAFKEYFRGNNKKSPRL